MRTLATTTSSSDQQAFLQYCVRALADLYGAKFAFVGRLKPNRQEVATLSVWAGDGYAENFEYQLEGTPCAEIVNFNKELIPTNASERPSPEDYSPRCESHVKTGLDHRLANGSWCSSMGPPPPGQAPMRWNEAVPGEQIVWPWKSLSLEP